MQQGQDLLALPRRQRLAGGPARPRGRAFRQRLAPPPVEGRSSQAQRVAEPSDTDLPAVLLDHGHHDRAVSSGRPRSAAKFFWASTRASARRARPVISASCRSSSAIRRSRASTGVGLRPRFFGARAASSPRARARRHITKCDEYNPSRRNSAPTAPDVAHASASLRMRRLYSAEYIRRLGLATTWTSSITAATCPSMGSSPLALITNFGGRHCLIHPGIEGRAPRRAVSGGKAQGTRPLDELLPPVAANEGRWRRPRPASAPASLPGDSASTQRLHEAACCASTVPAVLGNNGAGGGI